MDERDDYDDEPDAMRAPRLLMLVGWCVAVIGILGMVIGFFALFYMATNVAIKD